MKKELGVTNDWYNMIWSLDGQRIKAPIHITEATVQGVKYRIRWQEMSVPYNDMGHTYTATSWHGFLVADEKLQAEVSIYNVINKQGKKVWVDWVEP